jgi:uncharacterized protein YbcI
MPGTQVDRPHTGSTSTAISRALVRLLHDYTGRGPTKARTYLDDDLITVVLQDTLTTGELTLVREGRRDLVLATRQAFQETMGSDMIAAVEEHSGRGVRAFVSGNHIEPDIAIESFFMNPTSQSGETGPPEASGDGHR